MADGDPLQHVLRGDPLRIPAAAYNAFIDAARAHRGRGTKVARRTDPARRSAGVALIQNDSGAALGRFSILGITGPLTARASNPAAFTEAPRFTGETPAAGHAGKFAVLLEPIANGAVGRAVFAGLALCRVYVNDAGDGFADVKAADATQLDSGTSGSAVILWKDSGTGTQWAIVRLGGTGADDHLFIVSGDDTTPGDLETKLAATGGVTGYLDVGFDTQNPGGNEARRIKISHADVAAAAGGIELWVDEWVDISEDGTIPLDEGNWSGRNISLEANAIVGTPANARSSTIQAGGAYGCFVGDQQIGQQTIWVAGGAYSCGLAVDQADGGKLKVITSGYEGTRQQLMIRATAYARRTAASN